MLPEVWRIFSSCMMFFKQCCMNSEMSGAIAASRHPVAPVVPSPKILLVTHGAELAQSLKLLKQVLGCFVAG